MGRSPGRVVARLRDEAVGKDLRGDVPVSVVGGGEGAGRGVLQFGGHPGRGIVDHRLRAFAVVDGLRPSHQVVRRRRRVAVGVRVGLDPAEGVVGGGQRLVVETGTGFLADELGFGRQPRLVVVDGFRRRDFDSAARFGPLGFPARTVVADDRAADVGFRATGAFDDFHRLVENRVGLVTGDEKFGLARRPRLCRGLHFAGEPRPLRVAATGRIGSESVDVVNRLRRMGIAAGRVPGEVVFGLLAGCRVVGDVGVEVRSRPRVFDRVDRLAQFPVVFLLGFAAVEVFIAQGLRSRGFSRRQIGRRGAGGRRWSSLVVLDALVAPRQHRRS